MQRRSVVIVNKLGLHARAASRFVTTASTFTADVRVARGPREVNGKSIMGVMMLAAARGTVIDLIADGPDEEAALRALEALIADKFGEEE